MDFGVHSQAFLLLLSSIGAFLLSTIQLAPVTRLILWSIGAAMLSGSGYLMLKMTGMSLDHVFPAVTDTIQTPDDKSWLMTVIALNKAVIRVYLAPLLDLFLLFGGVVAVLTLIAFSPGEGIERVTRLLGFVVLGGIFGGLAALGAVALGFGGYPERAAYFGRISGGDVLDGDTFRLGGANVRLYGIDAAEKDQECYAQGETQWISRSCGMDASSHLLSLSQDELVICKRIPTGAPERYKRDKYGRVLASCDVANGPKKGMNLAQEMIKAGYAVPAEETEATVEAAATEARRDGRGLWGTCTLMPTVWREDRTARRNLQQALWDPKDVVSPEKCGAALPDAPAAEPVQ